MTNKIFSFSNKSVETIFDGHLVEILRGYADNQIVIISDENVYTAHQDIINRFQNIIVRAGELHKTQQTVDGIIQQLLAIDADKNTILIGVGGGVITDMTGYVASIYKRGVRLIQVPTTILAMTDAAIGGKNGVDVGVYKNMVGTIYQPEKIIFDYTFLTTLPREEWINGFAEIIKHACIKDAGMFEELKQYQIDDFINNHSLVADLIYRNVLIKMNIVTTDELETGDRKLLNFGHTLGHAIENICDLPHGHAISVGMIAAANFSVELSNLKKKEVDEISALLQQYHLPTSLSFDKNKTWEILLKDKKRDKTSMHFILLKSIGEGIVFPIPLTNLNELINQL